MFIESAKAIFGFVSVREVRHEVGHIGHVEVGHSVLSNHLRYHQSRNVVAQLYRKTLYKNQNQIKFSFHFLIRSNENGATCVLYEVGIDDDENVEVEAELVLRGDLLVDLGEETQDGGQTAVVQVGPHSRPDQRLRERFQGLQLKHHHRFTF